MPKLYMAPTRREGGGEPSRQEKTAAHDTLDAYLRGKIAACKLFVRTEQIIPPDIDGTVLLKELADGCIAIVGEPLVVPDPSIRELDRWQFCRTQGRYIGTYFRSVIDASGATIKLSSIV